MKTLVLFSALVSVGLNTFAGEVRGTGPLHVECSDGSKGLNIYNVNSLFFTGGKLIGNGFGPDRQDDGRIRLEGDCEITLNEKK